MWSRSLSSLPPLLKTVSGSDKMTFTGDSSLFDVLASAKGRSVLVKHMPELLEKSYALGNQNRTLKELQPVVYRTWLPALLRDLNSPAEEVWPEGVEQLSLDALDREAFAPRYTPWDAEPEEVALGTEAGRASGTRATLIAGW